MERVFSYGTLRQAGVQRQQFGRLLEGRDDAMVGWRLTQVEITDPDVLAKSGEQFHPIAVRTGCQTDRVDGQVFEMTEVELAAADSYEVDDYVRIAVPLASGFTAWVYVARDSSGRNGERDG